jgi:hypothetical protein
VLVVVDNNVLNGLVIDLKEVNQIVVITAVKKVDTVVGNDLDLIVRTVAVKKVDTVVGNDLDHQVQKEMEPSKNV